MSNYTSHSAVRAGLLASLRLDKNSKNVYTRFRPPVAIQAATGGAAATTDAAINVLYTGDGEVFAIRNEQPNTGGIVANGAFGLLLVNEGGDNDGTSIDLGYGAASAEVAASRGAYVIGTDAAFFIRMKLMVADVSDADQIAVGFVKGGHPIDGLLDTYTDYAVLNVDAGNVKIETRLNSGSASVVDTTADVIDHAGSEANAIELEVRVSAGGIVTFLVNGAAPDTDVNGFTFDSGDTVNAIFTTLNATTDDPEIQLLEFESGYLSSRGLSGTTDLQEAAQAD